MAPQQLSLPLFAQLPLADVAPQRQPGKPLSITAVQQKLCAVYHCPVPWFHELDPLSELISSLLSHRTKNADSGRAFKTLRRVLPSWEAVRDAPLPILESAIAAATWPEQKAPRIQQVLHAITRHHGSLTLDFLAGMDVHAARTWLENLPGIGPKTSAAVLLFSTLHRRAMPVDTHHYRVALRLGWMPPVSEARAHELLADMLPPSWTARQVYDHHEVMMFHGQQCCFYTNPACARCPLAEGCPTGQAHLAKAVPQA